MINYQHLHDHCRENAWETYYMDVVSYFIDKFNFLWIKDIFVFVTFIWYRELMPYQIIRNLKTWC